MDRIKAILAAVRTTRIHALLDVIASKSERPSPQCAACAKRTCEDCRFLRALMVAALIAIAAGVLIGLVFSFTSPL